MIAIRRLPITVVATAALVLALAVLSSANEGNSDKSAKCRIKNFGCLNEKFYRGAQPTKEDYADLAAMGVKTVINFQKGDAESEQKLVVANRMKFYQIGMSDKSEPAPEQVEHFLKIVNDPANLPVFVHCAGGRHRTGAMIAIYRMTHDGWTADRAYQEMKQFDFKYGIGHGPLKKYVYNYYSRIDHNPNGVVVTRRDN
jgi:tyrosine-protein phosphatase SIW14